MIIDISGWKVDETRNASGTREKHWLVKPKTDDLYLFKLPKQGTGEIWAEKIASEVGKLLGLEMMDVSLVRYKSREGLLLKNFVKYGEEELFDGGDLLKIIVDDFDPNSLDDYSLDNIISSLTSYDLEHEIVKIIVFDAFIANQDRHCENWGVIQDANTIRFAPIFDNGASLGFNSAEERIKLMLKDDMMFKSFTNRANSLIKIGEREKTKVKLLITHLYTKHPDVVSEEIARLDHLQIEDLRHILNTIPLEVMSEVQKQWVEKLLIYRRNWLKELIN
jgi:hypothetical protein